MATLLGPYALTVGQPFKLTLSAQTKQIELQNDSPNDVWVYFGDVEPTDLTNANNTWHRVVRRQHNGVLPVDGPRGANTYERSTNAFAAFKGIVWLLAVNPGALALTGTASGRNQVYVLPLEPGDPVPTYSALPTQQDLSSQPRVVSVPIGVSQYWSGQWSFSVASPSSTIYSPRLSPANKANFFVPVYFYAGTLAWVFNGAGAIEFKLLAQFLDGTHTPIGSPTELWHGYTGITAAQNPGTPSVFTPAVPLVTQMGGPVPGNAVYMGFILDAVSGTFPGMAAGTILADIDANNSGPNPDIGNGGLSLLGSAGSAPLY